MPPRLDKQFPHESSWATFSNKLVRHYKLPAGSEFRLKRKGATQARSAFMRNDSIIRRANFKKAMHPIGADVRAVDVVERISAMLAPNIKATVQAFGPGREPINGNMTLKSWRMKGPTQTELDEEDLRQDDISYLAEQAAGLIFSMQEWTEGCETRVPQAFLKALLRWFDEEEVRAAVAELKLD